MRAKLGLSPDDVAYQYPNAFMLEKTTGADRWLIGPASHQIATFLSLLQVLPEPFAMLYVLLVSHTGMAPGRYESRASRKSEVEEFIFTFKDYLESDGRHHLWVTSLPGYGTLVYDNHNVIYAYGRLKQFKRALLQQGLVEQDFAIPYPHAHAYNAAYDRAERGVMQYWRWRRTPLSSTDDDD